MSRANDPRKGFTLTRAHIKTGRNTSCPCGSGKKFKNCCMDAPSEETETTLSKWTDRTRIILAYIIANLDCVNHFLRRQVYTEALQGVNPGDPEKIVFIGTIIQRPGSRRILVTRRFYGIPNQKKEFYDNESA